jgi:hypothetical protein
MPIPLFEAPRLKLRRARTHIGELQTEIRRFLASEPFWLEVVDAPTFTNGKMWRVQMRHEVPLDFSAIIGDVIHNLRTTLDLVACDSVRANGQSTKGVYFPFADSAAALPDAITDKKMRRAKPEVVAFIEGLQPYTGGNQSLRAVHDLDVIDKHQALIPALDIISAPNVPGFETPQNLRHGPIRDGVGLATLGDHARLPIGTRARGEFVLTFDAYVEGVFTTKLATLGGSEVVPALISLANLIESLIDAFALIA